MELLSARDVDIIRGKVVGGVATVDEILSVFDHYQLVEANFDVIDTWDVFKEDPNWKDGWRTAIGIPSDVIPDRDEVVCSAADLSPEGLAKFFAIKMSEMSDDQINRTLGIT